MSTLGQDFYPDFADLPTVDELLDNDTPLEEATVYAHYFVLGFDFWLMALDVETGVAFGKVRMTECEFGSFDLKELCTANFGGFRVERETIFGLVMEPKPLSEFHTSMGA